MTPTAKSLREHIEWLKDNSATPVSVLSFLRAEADRLDVKFIHEQYVLELAKHLASTVSPSMEWEDWTSGTPGSFQEGYITEARTMLAKLDEDGLLVRHDHRVRDHTQWAKCDDVPDGVWYQSRDEGRWRWINRDGNRYTYDSACGCSGEKRSSLTFEALNKHAPFVMSPLETN